jgi:tRNA threonylcarbamoyladenosine modification (KEOPS) complex  Pcc1 subunit
VEENAGNISVLNVFAEDVSDLRFTMLDICDVTLKSAYKLSLDDAGISIEIGVEDSYVRCEELSKDFKFNDRISLFVVLDKCKFSCVLCCSKKSLNDKTGELISVLYNLCVLSKSEDLSNDTLKYIEDVAVDNNRWDICRSLDDTTSEKKLDSIFMNEYSVFSA